MNGQLKHDSDEMEWANSASRDTLCGAETKSKQQSIESWQNWMQQALISPQDTQKSDIENQFTPGAKLSASDCLAIYQRGYILRLTNCLAEQFPALCQALGAPLFEQFAKHYLQQCPSDSYTLYELGRRFADFLAQDRPDKNAPASQRESWIDFMIDLANYERLHFSLFDVPGHEGRTWPAPETPDQQLILQPVFELAQYQFPVGWYYHQVKDNPKTPYPPRQESFVVLIRTNYQVTTFPISHAHYLFLTHIKQHQDINQALHYMSKLSGQPLDLVMKSWRNEVRTAWLNAGFFVSKENG